MFRVIQAKINCVCVCVLLSPVVSQYVNTSNGANQHEEIIFRVSDGIPAKLGTVPYQVSFKAPAGGSSYSNFCGGGLIAPSKILSAAHCFVNKGNFCQKLCKKVQKKKFKTLYAVMGTLKTKGKYKKDGKSSEQWRRIRSTHIPPGYWFPKNDIAVVFTTKPFVFNTKVKAIPYATTRMDYRNIICMVSGYGRINLKDRSDILLYAKVKLLSKAKCKRTHGQNMDNFICTDARSGGNTQQGDSGGPLVCRNTGDSSDTGEGVIVGVVSGARKKKGRWQSFKTRVSNYRNFVRNKATKNLPVLNIIWISFIMSNFG